LPIVPPRIKPRESLPSQPLKKGNREEKAKARIRMMTMPIKAIIVKAKEYP
jgi:hypothetical protein